MTADFVDRIYEAAALPELWPDVFHDLSVKHEFVGAGMFSMNAQFQRGVASSGIRALLDDFLANGWMERNCRAPRTAALNYEGFVRDEDILTYEEIRTDPMYVELFRPHGVGYGAGSVVNAPSGDMIVFSFERAYELGSTPVAILKELDKLRPHLARAAVFSARLDIEKSRAQVSALEGLGLPAAVIAPNRRTLAVNALFETMSAQIAIGARDGVSMKERAAEALFAEAIAPGRRPEGRSIPLKGGEGVAPAVLHVLPVMRAARDVFSQAAWLLVATPLGGAKTPSASILCGLFDLTPAEARVARAITEGDTVADAAAKSGLSEATVRTQLRSIFAKTGTGRQAELVAMCGRLGAIGG